MGALSDGLLGFALGAGTTLSNEFDRINEEDTLIRRERRTTKRKIAAEGRANLESDRRSGRDEGLLIGREERTNTESDRRSTRDVGLEIGKESRANTEFERRLTVSEEYAIAAEERALDAEGAKMRYQKQLGLEERANINAQDLGQLKSGDDAGQFGKQLDEGRALRLGSIKSGVNIREKGAVTKEDLRLKREDDKTRAEQGLPPRNSSSVNLGLKSLTPTEVRFTIQDVANRTIGETEEQYNKNLKKEEIPRISKTLKSGGEDGRELVSTIINAAPGEGEYFDQNTVEMLHKELSHITLAALGSKTRHASKNKGIVVQGPDLEEAARGAVEVASTIEDSMIKAWSQADSPGFIGRLAARNKISDKEAKDLYIKAVREDLRDIMKLSEAEATKSIAYKRIWNIYKRPLMDLINGKMEGGMITDR